jgi:pectin methylesterase-like acyl-CoA thioesterase
MNPRVRLALLCGFAWLLLLSTTVQARTWRVARDGSGDYTTIQPAIDWASAGDTISIGAGVYTECRTVRLPGWSWSIEIYVYAMKDNLTLIGF